LGYREGKRKEEGGKKLRQRVLSERRDQERTTLNEEINNIDKEVKRKVRNDKERHVESRAEETEEACRKGDLRTVFKITKHLTGKMHSSSGTLKDKNGNILDSEKKQRERWKERFSDILNRPAPDEIHMSDDLETVNHQTPKERKLTECGNRIELTLLSVPGTILCRIILDRMNT